MIVHRPSTYRSGMRHLAVALSLAIVAPSALAAQGIRLGIEPRVTGLPGRAAWKAHTEAIDARAGDSRLMLRRTTEVARDPLALVGGRLTLGSARWRLALDGGYGRTRVNSRQQERNRIVSGAGEVSAIDGTSFGHEREATLLQLGIHVERAGRWRRWATEASGGLMAQRLVTRADSAFFAPPTSPPSWHRVDGGSYTDPALAFGLAVGPSTGALAGLRVGVRSTHVWRTPDLVNDWAESAYPELAARGRAWQWQPELSIGWRFSVGG